MARRRPWKRLGSGNPGPQPSPPAVRPTPPAPSTPATGPAGPARPAATGPSYLGGSIRDYRPPTGRSAEQIRADIEAQREDLGRSVEELRDRVTELTDWRGQIRKHRKQIVVGAVAVGFVVGGLAALRRR